jgi:hypothetical protein
MNDKRFEVKAIANGWSYRAEKNIRKANEQGSLWIAFTNEPNARYLIWPFVGPDYFKGFELEEEVVCCFEAVSEKTWRLTGIAGISKIDESGLPIIDPEKKIGDLDQPSADSIIFDARQASNREIMPTYYP